MRDSVQDLGVAAAERALTILRAFDVGNLSLSLTEIAERAGLYKSTTLRLLTSLERHGFVVHLASGSYRLGPALLYFGNLYQRSFRLEDHVTPVLQDLVEKTGESAAFHVREGTTRLCLFRVDSKHSIRDHIQVGDIIPLSKGASGRVLTAFAKGPDASQKLPFVSFGEFTIDSAGLAVPVFGMDNKLLGAIALTGPRTRFSKTAVARMSSLLVRAGEALSVELGSELGAPGRAANGANGKIRRRGT